MTVPFVKALKLAYSQAKRTSRNVPDDGPLSDELLVYTGPQPADDFSKAGLTLQGVDVILSGVKTKRWARTAAMDMFVQVMAECGYLGFKVQ